MGKKLVILVGGSDLFSGLRGISKGTRLIREELRDCFDEIITVNYNYFLDFGYGLKRLRTLVTRNYSNHQVFLYGYSKGGELVLKLAWSLQAVCKVELLVTIDIANGPWSANINRSVPGNVKRNINVFQRNPVFPLRSYGLPAYSDEAVLIENIDHTNSILQSRKVNHSNIEMLMVPQTIEWLKSACSC